MTVFDYGFAVLTSQSSTLSGGNQQKVALSKWLATTPRIIIFDEPTQGVDVQTKAEVHAMIAALARHGSGNHFNLVRPSRVGQHVSSHPRTQGGTDERPTSTRDQVSQEKIMYAATGASAGQRSSEGTLVRPGAENVPRSSEDVAMPAQMDSSAFGASTRPVWHVLLRKALARRELGLIIAMAAVVIPVSALNPRMLSGSNLTALSMDAALLSIVAAAQMLVIITRNIDLSVASVIGLAAYISAATLRAHPDLNIIFALALACAVGLGCGIINGLVVTVGRVPAIVVTLGTLSLVPRLG